MSFHGDYQPEYSARTRTTDAPVAMDMAIPPVGPLGHHHGYGPQPNTLPALIAELTAKLPQAWVGMGGYLVGGIFLGLVLIGALSLGRGGNDANAE